MYEIPEDGTGVPKHVGLVKDHTFQYIRKLCTDVVL